MNIRPTILQGFKNLFRFAIAPPSAGTYTFTSASTDQTLDLGTYWQDASNHALTLSGDWFDFANGFQFFNMSSPVYVSSYFDNSGGSGLQGTFIADYLASTVDATGAIIDSNLEVGLPVPFYSMIRDFQGTLLSSSEVFQDAAGCLGFRLQGDSTIGSGPSKIANGIKFSLSYLSGTYITGQSVTVVVPPIMYYIGGAFPALQ